MRIRSYQDHRADDCHMPETVPRCARGRSSKIQNNALRVCVGSQTMEVFFELQALLHKDANTVAHALRAAVNYVTEAAVARRPGDSRLRLVHLITGDGVPTNMAACRRLWQALQKDPRVEYAMIVWLCVAHQVNLVVQVAICGKLLQDPINANALCGACVRLFKYLIKDYFEEFAAALRAFVVRALRAVPGDSAAAAIQAAQVLKLRALYGDRVLPPALVRFYTLGFAAPLIPGTPPD